MKEYDCWMQHTESVIPAPLDAMLSTVVTEAGCDFAAVELRYGLKRFAPVSCPEPGKQTLLGTIVALNRQYQFTLPKQAPEGFVIQVSKTTIIIAGQDTQGLLYGVYRFLARLDSGAFKGDINREAEAPATPIRMINHWDNLDGTVERGYAGRSLFFNNDQFDYIPERIEQYARLLASVGINRLSLNNVNVRAAAKRLITEEYLPALETLATIFRPFGIRLMISVNFAAPYSLGILPTADPLEPSVATWWQERVALIYRYVPDLAGFVVKADSEHEPGPFQYGRSHADGANVLAAALKPYGATVIWRCFVYNCTQDWRDRTVDRARAAYDHFKPLDGHFADNVILQIKHGPYDFQVSEPVSPLFGALSQTQHLMELQITQEYTGHQIDLCFLPWMWEKVLRFDTEQGTSTSITNMIISGRISGIAGVGNAGTDQNWTGHTLAQANLYGFARMAWNPALSAGEIAHEWAALSFGHGAAASAIAALLLGSYPTYQKYNAPFGICFMVEPGFHYGPNIEGYEYSRWGTYHRADTQAIGIDRTSAGTGYTTQYAPVVEQRFADPATCPEELLLFFHRLPYGFIMKNGRSLLQNIYDTHFEGYDEVQAMLDQWIALKEQLDQSIYESVKERLEWQRENARQWRDVINSYFYRRTGIDDISGRTIY
jgi:alpha-glucuronidase